MRRYFYQTRRSTPHEAHRDLGCFRLRYLLERELSDAAEADRRDKRRMRALPDHAAYERWRIFPVDS